MVGVNIKKLRKQKGLTQRQLCKLADVNYSTLTKIETGIIASPRIEQLSKIAKALEVSIDDLLIKSKQD